MDETDARPPLDWKRVFGLCVAVSLVLSLLATFAMSRAIHYSLFEAGNLVGPTAYSLLHGRGMEFQTGADPMGHPFYLHGSRMPFATLVVAGIVLLIGPDRFVLASLIKAVLFLVPVWAAMRLALRDAAPRSRTRAAVLLLVPFATTALLANVANLQVEEGYAYSLLAFAFALVLFPDREEEAKHPYRRAIWLGLTLAGLFLTKSSLVLITGVILVGYLVQQRGWGPRSVVVVMLVGAILGWGFEQKSVSGRFSVGTSLDGINLHKGNNAKFAERYPPPPGDNLDRFDGELTPNIPFKDEWAFDEYHKAEAVRYIREHPAETIHQDARKAFQYYLSLSKTGSTESHGAVLIFETAGLALFRLGFLAAVFLSVRGVWTGNAPGRLASWTLLGIAVLGAVPYVLGFAYTRHASVLILPVALLLCRSLPRRTAEGS